MAYGPPPYGQPGWQQQPSPPGTRPMPGQHGQMGQMGHGPVSHDEKSWALMAYVGQFLVGAIAPAVVLVSKGRSPFVRRHAAQGLNIGLAAFAVWMVGGLLSLMIYQLIWIPLGFTAAVMFFLVVAARAANRGEFRAVPAFVAWPILKSGR